MRIPEYFKDKELACPCCGKFPEQRSVNRLYALRILYRKPIKITSAMRCPAYNDKIGGSKNSQHKNGIAFDCKIPKEDELQFISMAVVCGFKGVGFKDNVFIHIDTRQTPVIWGY